MTPERRAEIERMLEGGMHRPDILRDWVQELLTALREAEEENKRLMVGWAHTGTCDAHQRRAETLEHAIRCYESALVTGTVCLAGHPCQAPERDHRHWAQVEYLNLQQLIGALRGGGMG